MQQLCECMYMHTFEVKEKSFSSILIMIAVDFNIILNSCLSYIGPKLFLNSFPTTVCQFAVCSSGNFFFFFIIALEHFL